MTIFPQHSGAGPTHFTSEVCSSCLWLVLTWKPLETSYITAQEFFSFPLSPCHPCSLRATPHPAFLSGVLSGKAGLFEVMLAAEPKSLLPCVVNPAKLNCVYFFFFLQSFLEISILENSVFPHKVLAASPQQLPHSLLCCHLREYTRRKKKNKKRCTCRESNCTEGGGLDGLFLLTGLCRKCLHGAEEH